MIFTRQFEVLNIYLWGAIWKFEAADYESR